MTPEEKAVELIQKYWKYLDIEIATEYAAFTVDEILKVVSRYNDTQAEVLYWKEVKEKI